MATHRTDVSVGFGVPSDAAPAATGLPPLPPQAPIDGGRRVAAMQVRAVGHLEARAVAERRLVGQVHLPDLAAPSAPFVDAVPIDGRSLPSHGRIGRALEVIRRGSARMHRR